MRSTFIVTVILLVAAFAVAQQGTTPPSAPDGANSSQTQSQPGTTPAQAATPSMPMAGSDMIEGCLGGSNPNYTVTDKAGTTYSLLIPAGADASPLAKHIGESVMVQGSLDNAGTTSKSESAAGAGASSSSAAAGKAIRVAKIGRGTGTCPTSSNSGAAPKPPSK